MYKVKKEDLIGEIKDLSIEVVQEMVDEQIKQTGDSDVTVFQKYMGASRTFKGFDWESSEKGVKYWKCLIGRNRLPSMGGGIIKSSDIQTITLPPNNNGIDYTILYQGKEYKMSDILSYDDNIKELEEEIERLKQVDESGEREINNLVSGQSREISLLKKQNEHMKEVLSAIGIIYSAYIKQE